MTINNYFSTFEYMLTKNECAIVFNVKEFIIIFIEVWGSFNWLFCWINRLLSITNLFNKYSLIILLAQILNLYSLFWIYLIINWNNCIKIIWFYFPFYLPFPLFLNYRGLFGSCKFSNSLNLYLSLRWSPIMSESLSNNWAICLWVNQTVLL